MTSLECIEVPRPFGSFRRFALDGALLLFDRTTGTNVRCEGNETAGLVQVAPRSIQFGITNDCNLACTFCSRPREARSSWTRAEALQWLAEFAELGVLEVAFGGGEPWQFDGFDRLVLELHEHTALAVNVTTNGLALTPRRIESISGCYGEIRLSLYDDNDWRTRVAWLVDANARFGVNWLVTPERSPRLEATVLELVALGCRSVLLLSYNGRDESMHLDVNAAQDLESRVERLARALRGQCRIQLDVCWGERLERVPRLFARADCGAGRDFLTLTSDRRVQPCSFHDLSLPVTSPRQALELWRTLRGELARASTLPGCARSPDLGLRALREVSP